MVNFDDLEFRKSTKNDLGNIITLLLDDTLGVNRESESDLRAYIEAYDAISQDSNQFLMVVAENKNLLGTCHLTLMPSLTFKGSLRLNIEAVRVNGSYRGQGIGEWMFQQVVQFAKDKQCKILQLATNIQRTDALRFYEKLGFVSSHVGMKMSLDLSGNTE